MNDLVLCLTKSGVIVWAAIFFLLIAGAGVALVLLQRHANRFEFVDLFLDHVTNRASASECLFIGSFLVAVFTIAYLLFNVLPVLIEKERYDNALSLVTSAITIVGWIISARGAVKVGTSFAGAIGGWFAKNDDSTSNQSDDDQEKDK